MILIKLSNVNVYNSNLLIIKLPFYFFLVVSMYIAYFDVQFLSTMTENSMDTHMPSSKFRDIRRQLGGHGRKIKIMMNGIINEFC